MRQGYVERQDELPYVRGRLQFAASTRPWTRPGLIACEFADFLPDTPENRVLKATLEALGRSRLRPGLRARALGVTGWLHDVALLPLSRHLINAIHWTRLNAHYRPAVDLCRLYLDGRAVEQQTGDVIAPSFMFPMERVFEAAVANYLAGELDAVTIQPSRSVAPIAGEPMHPLVFRPDLLVGEPVHLVLDTKYANAERRTRFGTRSFRNDDLYQIAFYANEYGCPGLLAIPGPTGMSTSRSRLEALGARSVPSTSACRV
jgi:5-methylcytosine-specific restriction enzyme subunit McrC